MSLKNGSADYDYDAYGNKIRKFIVVGFDKAWDDDGVPFYVARWTEVRDFAAERGFDRKRYNAYWKKGEKL